MLLLASACSFGERGGGEVDRPNVVLIIGDDHGYTDFGFMGSPYVETPQLDRLAAKGTVFTHGYDTASVCRPSLLTLLTGFYPHQFATRGGVLWAWDSQRELLASIRAFSTLPRQLAERGYASFQAGKLWQGSYLSVGFTDGMIKPGRSLRDRFNSRSLGRTVPLDPVFDFIDAHADQPFFVWFAPMLPHAPFDAPVKYRRRYAGRSLTASAVRYYANITRFDDLVGELVAHLEEAGLRERTLVVYLADNGWDQKPHEEISHVLGGDRGKRSMHELGLRTPIVFSWPGVVPGGVVSDALVSTVDLFPTLLDYAGAPQRSGWPGRSLRRLIQEGTGWRRERVIGLRSYPLRDDALGSLRGKPPTEPEQLASELEGPAAGLEGSASGGSPGPPPDRSYFLRDRDWWYIWHRDRRVDRLYDAGRDPRAERDLAPEQPEVVGRLRERIRAWDAETRGFREALQDDRKEPSPSP